MEDKMVQFSLRGPCVCEQQAICWHRPCVSVRRFNDGSYLLRNPSGFVKRFEAKDVHNTPLR